MTKACFEAVLFDLDGTLADTAPDLIRALNRVLEEEGRAPKCVSELRASVSRGGNGLIPLAFGISMEDPSFEGLKARFISNYHDQICVDTKPFDGILSMLETLRAKGIPWGIVTNKIRSLTVRLLERLPLPTPDCVVCADDASRAKPWPDTLWLAAKLLNADPAHCLYVGDYHRDIEAAHAAGMSSAAASYGYREAEPAIETWGAHYLIDSPLELLPILWPDDFAK